MLGVQEEAGAVRSVVAAGFRLVIAGDRRGQVCVTLEPPFSKSSTMGQKAEVWGFCRCKLPPLTSLPLPWGFRAPLGRFAAGQWDVEVLRALDIPLELPLLCK